MRWFCTQPDIIEDARDVRYHTKSSGGTLGTFLPPSSRAPTTKSKRAPASYNGTVSDGGARMGMTRTASSNVSHGGKRQLASEGHGTASISAVGISGPMPIEQAHLPATMGFLHSSPPPMIVSTHPGPPPAQMEDDMAHDKSKSLDLPAMNLGMVTDSEREGLPKQLRRKSRRMSAPLTAFGIHIGSGTDTDTTAKRRRVSKVMIGAPEGFKHEGHVGMGGTFTNGPDIPDLWSVEAWRAEIERTLTVSLRFYRFVRILIGFVAGLYPTNLCSSQRASSNLNIESGCPTRRCSRDFTWTQWQHATKKSISP